MRVILVRHGESVGNSENRLQGYVDYDLTQKGRAEAVATADRLHVEGVTVLYTSPLLRAAATATVVAERTGLPAIALPGVAEYDSGELSGETYAQLRERFGGPAVSPDGRPVERVYPGEEGRDVFFRRVTAAFDTVVNSHPAETVAIITHGGPIALLSQTVLGLPYRRPMPFAIDNCSLTIVRVEEGELRPGRPGRVLVTLNDANHLRDIRARD